MTKDQLTTQSPEDIRLQKYRCSLISSGGAMVLFSLWTVLRSLVQIDAQLNYRGNSEALMPLVTTIVVVGIIDLVLKLYVGLSARLEGLARGKKRPYLVLGIIIAGISLLSLVFILLELPTDIRMYGVLTPIITLVVEITVLYAAMDLVISATKMRRLEEEMGRVY